MSVHDCWDVAANFPQILSKLDRELLCVLHRGRQGMDSILKGSLWEHVRLLLSQVQLRVTARCWNIGENCGPFGAFFLSLLKLDRSGEKVVTW